jgi:hypothetical protein
VRLVVGDGVVRLCGIRHHGPGSARALAAELHDDPPDVVLVEGPAEAGPITHLAIDPDMRPPVALLGHVLDRPERAAFFPFASFSPEWVAITWACGSGVPVRWIDLPLVHALAEVEDHGASRGARRPRDPLAELAAAAGYDDPERWWEDALEHRVVRDAEVAGCPAGVPADRARPSSPFAAVADAMIAVRGVLEPDGEPDDPVERRREAAMRAGIRAALADGFRRIVVVCGAWHVPALATFSAPGRARADKAALTKLPRAKAAITWVPWTHRRLASGTGYGAGVVAPGWYDHLFAHSGPDVVVRWFTEAARLLRAADHGTSAADVVEATRLADALATLRGRPLPGLAEVDDAARAVLGGGSDAPMRLLSSALVIGDRIGHVPDATPMVPLARDLAAEQRRCRLRPDGAARTLELDLRRHLDRERSRVLHRLGLLDVPWGVQAEGRGTTGTFRETWQLRWEPELEVRLIERAALGTRVATAAAAALGQRAAAASTLGELTALLETCLLAGLDGSLPDLVAQVADRSAAADDVVKMLEAVPPLARTIRYGDVRGTDSSALGTVVRGIVGRIAAGLGIAATGLDDDGAAALCSLVRDAQAGLGLLADPEDLDCFERALATIVEGPRLHGRLQGLATRLLADANRLDPDAVERRLSRALSRGASPLDAAAFVEGFLGGSGAVLVHDPLLLGVLDRWIATLPATSFVEVLPLLRRTFGGFEMAERREIGERVRTGEAPGGRRGHVQLDAARAAAGLVTMGHLLGVGR